MRRKFERLRDNLQGFVRQREHLTMVLHLANDSDITYVLKYLDALEKQSRSDLYLVFGHACTTPGEYIDTAMAECEMSIEIGNAGLEEGLGEPGAEPWPGLPSACFDAARTPKERIQALVAFIRERYPSPDVRILFAFVPIMVGDANAYAAAMQELFAFDGYEPWMAGVRILMRDSQREPKLVPWLQEREAFATLVYPIDFGTDALNQALATEAADPALPMDERMMALFQVGALDHAYDRPKDALLKFGAAYDHYLREKDPAMQGLCLLGSAYVLERQSQLEAAEERFRQTLELALANELHQLMLNCFLALGGLRQRAEDWSEAEGYWKGATVTAKYLSNAVAMADAMEQIGVCRVALNDNAEALKTWEAALRFADAGRHFERWVSLLEHLIEIEEREGLHDARRAHLAQLDEARTQQAVAEHERQEALAGRA